MELDLAGMHQLAAGQGIDPETLDAALSEALRLAYLKTPHAAKRARVELDPRAGSFTVWAQDEIPGEPTEDDPHPAPTLGEEYDDTPHDFGRLAAATARQVISQLFRKAEDDKVFGAFSGQKASSSPASCSRTSRTHPTCTWPSATSKPAAAPRAGARRTLPSRRTYPRVRGERGPWSEGPGNRGVPFPSGAGPPPVRT